MSGQNPSPPPAVKLAFAPVGALLIKNREDLKGLPPELVHFRGISYCEALTRATAGEPVLVGPDSIQVCRWSPPALGLKTPESDFEKGREPRLPFLIAGIFLRRLEQWPGGPPPPEVVLLRADREELQKLLALLPPERIYRESAGLDRTAVPLLLGEQARPVKARLVRMTNRSLGWLNRFPRWRRFTVFAFKREWTSRMLNFLLDRTMANMSICRNSTVIPYLTGTVNVSHFCTGGISWGGNPPSLLTAGLPYELFESVKDRLKS